MKWTTTSVLGLVMMASAATSEAQEPVATFSELNSRLRIGDKVWVTDTQGREHHGRLTGLQDASLTLDTASPTTLRADSVREIRRQRRDSLLNGMLIGFGAGALFGRFTDKGSKCGSDPECLLYPGTYGAIGMGIGALADVIVPGREVVVYRVAGGRTPPQFQLRPVLWAQESASSFDQLRTRLKPGDKIRVVAAGGKRTKGILESIESSSLTLRQGLREPKRFPVAQVREVHSYVADSLRNGIIGGAAIGALGGLALIASQGGDGPDSVWPFCGSVAAVGALIGGTIDSQRVRTGAVLYRAPGVRSSVQFSVTPLVTRSMRGVAVSFSF